MKQQLEQVKALGGQFAKARRVVIPKGQTLKTSKEKVFRKDIDFTYGRARIELPGKMTTKEINTVKKIVDNLTNEIN